MSKSAIVIGSGFAGMSAASFLAKDGWQVTVVEKHDQPGGRARRMLAEGFTFDMGPSWYWMPDVFERYFNQFGKSVADYYALERLDPSYRIYWADDYWDIPANYDELKAFFEKQEKGAGAELDKVMKEAAYKYDVGIHKLVLKPGRNWSEFLDKELMSGVFKLDVFTSVKKHFSKHFKHPKIRQLLEFPVLFLGALSENTPALYTLMNYADIKGGTWFPKGGMYKIVEAMHLLAEELGVRFLFEHDVNEITLENGKASGIKASVPGGEEITVKADLVVSGADYHFTEKKLLPEKIRNYSDAYWQSRVMAPGCIIFYVGLNKKVEGLQHHTLFFDVPFAPHAQDIYTSPRWPDQPLFYVSATSVTDPTQAPEGGENLFFLIPVAAGIDGDEEELRLRYFDMLVERFQQKTGVNIKEHMVFFRSYGEANFKEDYNAFKGNAYGLANTLRQTAVLKPSCFNKKVSNLFYTGQLTVPGPGVPPSLISGEVVAAEVKKFFG